MTDPQISEVQVLQAKRHETDDYDILLRVSHMARVKDLEFPTLSGLMKRFEPALLIVPLGANRRRVERRLMMARATQARRDKAKRV